MSKKDNLFAKGISGIKWMSFASFTTSAVNFLLTVILARILSARDYGAFQAIAVLIGFADMLWALGIGPALVRKKELLLEDICTGHTINILLGILIFGIINIFSPLWSSIFAIENQRMLHAYSLIFLINTFFAVPRSMLHRECRYKVLAISTITGVLSHAVIGIILAIGGLGAWALIISSIAQYLIQSVLIIPYVHIKCKIVIHKKSLRDLAYFGGGYTLMNFFNYFALQGDNYIVNKFIGTTALGYYGKAYNLMGYPTNFIGQTLDQVMYPILAKVQDDTIRVKRIFLSETSLVGLATVPITIIGVVCRNELVDFLLGPEWSEVADPMMILLLALFFRTAYKINFSVLKSVGEVYKMALSQFFYAVSVAVFCFVGCKRGIAGVASGASIAIVINYSLSLIFLMQKIRVTIIDMMRSYLCFVVYFIITFGVTYYAYCLLHPVIRSSILLLIIVTIIVFVVYSLEYIATQEKIVLSQVREYVNRAFMALVVKAKSAIRFDNSN